MHRQQKPNKQAPAEKDNVEEMLVDSSKKLALMAADAVMQRPELLGKLLEVAYKDKPKFSMRAANVIEICCSGNPGLVRPFFGEIIQNLPRLQNEGAKRCLLKIFTTHTHLVKNDDIVLGTLVNCCYNYLLSLDESIGIRYYSMIILYEISHMEPDLKKELLLTLEDLEHEESPALKIQVSRLLKKLYKEIDKR